MRTVWAAVVALALAVGACGDEGTGGELDGDGSITEHDGGELEHDGGTDAATKNDGSVQDNDAAVPGDGGGNGGGGDGGGGDAAVTDDAGTNPTPRTWFDNRRFEIYLDGNARPLHREYVIHVDATLTHGTLDTFDGDTGAPRTPGNAFELEPGKWRVQAYPAEQCDLTLNDAAQTFSQVICRELNPPNTGITLWQWK